MDGTIKAIYKLPRAHAFDAQINPLKASINDALRQASSLAEKADDWREKWQALTRVTMHQAELIAYISAYANEDGPPRQDVAYSVYLLKKYGGLTTPDLANAAEVVANKERRARSLNT